MKPLDEHDPAFAALYNEMRERARSSASSRACPRRSCTRCSTPSPTRAGSPTSSPATSSCRRREAGPARDPAVEERLRRVLVHVQRQIGCSRRRTRSSRRSRRSWASASARCTCASSSRRSRRSWARTTSATRSSELREKLAKLELPKEARAEVERELGRLERSGRESMEAQVIRTYLEWIAELPWNTRRDDHLDLTTRGRVLDEDHYGLQDVKDRVLEFLAVRQLRAGRAGARRSRRPARCRQAPRRGRTTSRRRRSAARRGRRRSPTQGGEGARDGEGADPALRRPAGRRQDVDRQVDRPVARARVRPRRARRRARRGRHPRPPPHLRRRDARPDHPGA